MGEYDRVLWRGEAMTRRQRQALIAVEEAIQKRYPGFEFQVPQGSWEAVTPWSGTSHTGAGVVDLQYPGFYGDVGYSTKAEKDKARFVWRSLIDVGKQAAFFRGPWSTTPNDPDGMILHFHVCDLDTRGMSYTSRTFQVPEWKRGNDGLITGRTDRFGYRPDPIRKWRFKA
jgi:hypothetical protein